MSFVPLLRHPGLLAILAVVLGLAATPLQGGGFIPETWPQAAGPCAGTLQACVDAAANGTRIEISSEAPIDETLHIRDRSLWLAAAPGEQPRFAPGRRIVGELVAPAAQFVGVHGIAFHDGGVDLACSGGGSVTINLRDLDIENPDGIGWSGIRLASSDGCHAVGSVYDNRVEGSPTSPNSGLIHLSSQGGRMFAAPAFNTVTRTGNGSGQGAGVLVSLSATTGGGSEFVHVFGNTIRGRFSRGGIAFSEGLFVETATEFLGTAYNNVVVCPDGLGSGIVSVVNHGTITSQIINNTVSNCEYGVQGMGYADGSDSARIQGFIGNNLLVARTRGIELHSEHTPDLYNNFNLIDAPSAANVAVGADSILAPARLVSIEVPRLRPDSPAIDAAEPMLLAKGLALNNLPPLDADGLRRTRGAAPDHGAHEHGDVSFRHVASMDNSVGQITFLEHPAAAHVDAFVLASRHAGQHAYQPWGVYWAGSSSQWTLYHDNLSVVQPGSSWSVWVPQPGPGVFRHLGEAGNTAGASTVLDSPDLHADDILVVAYNWSPTGNYNVHPVGVFHDGGSNRWHIANLDQQPLPVPNAFNVYSQWASPNAFRLLAATGSTQLDIDHPLANDSACTLLHITRVMAQDSPPTSGGVDLHRDAGSGRWSIRSAVPFVAGTAFNVLIDPAQVFDCNDRIFANGLE